MDASWVADVASPGLDRAVVSIRPAAASDLDAVADIERAVFNDPWSRRSFNDLVDTPQVLFFVAVDVDDAVLGYSIALIHGDEAELANIAVGRVVQHLGLGRRLLRRAIDGARERGCTAMFLEVRASNAAAIHLYSTTGFEAVGRRRRYYSKPVEDAIVMKASLGKRADG